MNLEQFVSSIGLPLSILTAGTFVFVAIALSSPETRRETISVINGKNFGTEWFRRLAQVWAIQFRFIFGLKFLAKRQVLTVPIYTTIVSVLFFSIWLVYTYVLQNRLTLPLAPLPINMREAINVFYFKGLVVAICIDFVTIQFTKICIGVGERRGYTSLRFLLYFILAAIISFFIYTVIVLLFRIEDMVRLYMEVAPNDLMPLVKYEPINFLTSSLKLFQPQTYIYVTSQGWVSSYFMPESIIFYGMITSQLSLLIILLSYFMMSTLNGFKKLCLGTVRIVGTPNTNANSVILAVTLGLVSILVIAFFLLATLQH